jgi:predicted ATP-binding protein involved in virulence
MSREKITKELKTNPTIQDKSNPSSGSFFGYNDCRVQISNNNTPQYCTEIFIK